MTDEELTLYVEDLERRNKDMRETCQRFAINAVKKIAKLKEKQARQIDALLWSPSQEVGPLDK